jgi:short-subunit dehydrogenase
MQLAGKRALVTGSGSGLGLEIALALARAGAEVIITDRESERVAAAIARLKAAGFNATGHIMDVTSAEQVTAIRDRIRAERGPIDLLVNNAGVVFGGDFLAVPADRHATTVAVNLTGALNVTHAFLPDLIARPESHLVNIASASAVVPLPGGVSYSATKAAIVHFSDSLREELRLQGHRQIGISTICPSYIATGLFEGARPARFTWMLSPESVARSVVRAIERRRNLVLLPWTVSAVYTATRFLPAGIYHWICRLLGVSTSMTNWRGRDNHSPKSFKQSKPNE